MARRSRSGSSPKALHPYPAGLVIATKGGLLRPSAGQWSPNCQPAHLKEACEGSLKRLKLDRIDLYQSFTPMILADAGGGFDRSAGGIARSRQDPSHRRVEFFRLRAEARAKDRAGIASVQNINNFLNDRTNPTLVLWDRCAAEGLGFPAPYFPLAVGGLSRASSPASTTRSRNATTPLQVKSPSRGLLKRSPVMLPIPGTSSVAHLEENVAAAKVQLSDDDFQSARALGRLGRGELAR